MKAIGRWWRGLRYRTATILTDAIVGRVRTSPTRKAAR